MREFQRCHPIINVLYFAVVLVLSACVVHPMYIGINLFCGLCTAVLLKGSTGLKQLRYLWFLALAAALYNPLFRHEGVTVLCYLPSGNPLTWESVLYGLAMGALLAGVCGWFYCMGAVMTGDKWMHVLGKLAPSFSLVFSMTLRLIPKYRIKLGEIREARRGIGRDFCDGSIAARIKSAVAIVSMLMTRCLEEAVMTADSMRDRGYGLPGRTAFTYARLSDRDKRILIVIVILLAAVLVGILCGGGEFRYFPAVEVHGISLGGMCATIAYFLFCMLPIWIEVVEVIRWKSWK